jgi:hypothetical protein
MKANNPASNIASRASSTIDAKPRGPKTPLPG